MEEITILRDHQEDEAINEAEEFIEPASERDVAGLEALTVKIWENEIAWAAYRERIKEKGY